MTTRQYALAHAKYKVGDLVVCVNVDDDETEVGVNTISVITSIQNTPWPINAYDLNNQIPVAFSLTEIRKFDPDNDSLEFLEVN